MTSLRSAVLLPLLEADAIRKADFGAFQAHNGLWEMAEKTNADLLARIALVPRTLEARGLDPVATYAELSERYKAPHLRGPFNLEARRAAGFDEEELAALGR